MLNGIVRGKQRFRCQHCACHYTQSTARGYGLDKKLHALHLYKEGLGFRSIGRLLDVSNVTVLNGIRGIGQEVQHFVARHTGAVLASRLGNRGRKTAKRLWAALTARYHITQVMTDSWKVYRKLIPAWQRRESQAET